MRNDMKTLRCNVVTRNRMLIEFYYNIPYFYCCNKDEVFFLYVVIYYIHKFCLLYLYIHIYYIYNFELFDLIFVNFIIRCYTFTV